MNLEAIESLVIQKPADQQCPGPNAGIMYMGAEKLGIPCAAADFIVDQLTTVPSDRLTGISTKLEQKTEPCGNCTLRFTLLRNVNLMILSQAMATD